MTRAEICSYLRGRLQLRVQALDDGTFALSPLPRDVGDSYGRKVEPEIWDLRELCREYGIELEKVGLEVSFRTEAAQEIEAENRARNVAPCLCGHLRKRHAAYSAGTSCADCDCPAFQAPPVGPEHPRYLPFGALDQYQRPCPATLDGYLCTRGLGHQERETGPAGDHAAHNLNGEMVRRWPPK